MVLIVGLGNPGEKYAYSRHNIGFMVVDSLLKKLGKVNESIWVEEKRLECLVARVKERESGGANDRAGEPKGKRVKDGEIILVKPQAYMNTSGVAVAKIINFYKINPSNLFVIHDDVDITFGKIKVVVNRGAAGHHGVESIIQNIGTTNFIRVRVGVGMAGIREVGIVREIWKRTRATEAFVLKPFSKRDEGKLNEVIKRAVKAIDTILKGGLDKAMNLYN